MKRKKSHLVKAIKPYTSATDEQICEVLNGLNFATIDFLSNGDDVCIIPCIKITSTWKDDCIIKTHWEGEQEVETPGYYIPRVKITNHFRVKVRNAYYKKAGIQGTRILRDQDEREEEE